MKLSCTSCQTNYQIPDDKIPARGARANCANCGQVILIPGTGVGDQSSSLMSESSKADYGQTMAYDYSEVDQSQTEISAFLEKISDREPFIGPGLLLALRDTRTGKEYFFSNPQITLGRSGTDISVDDPEVSRRHCQVKVFGDRIVILDLESTNGTFVLGKKVMTASLGISEQFGIGNTIFELVSKQAG
jgi:predicted Zn finger-like uncharacterized protein